MSHPDDRLLPGPGRARICGSGARGGDGEDLQAVTPVFLRVTLWHMCNKHFRSSAKCIENSKKGRSKYISVKSHMTSFTKFEDGLYEPDDLDLVYQGGNLTGAETCPYPVHIWQGGIIERPVGAVSWQEEDRATVTIRFGRHPSPPGWQPVLPLPARLATSYTSCLLSSAPPPEELV